MSGGYTEEDYLDDEYLTQQQEQSMVDRSKIIFVNTDGDFEETSVADSLQFASFKTANYELTDALLGDVTNLMIKSDGSRAYAANQPMGGFKLTGLAAGSANGDSIRYEQLQDVIDSIANLEFQDSVIDRVTAPPGLPSAGDRYLIIATATGDFAGKEDQIAEWNGSAWVYTIPAVGFFLSVDDENDRLYYYTGSAWAEKYFEATTASLGVEKVGMDIRLDLLSGGGLKLTGNEVGVEPGDFAGDGLVDDGSDNLAIDWATDFTIGAADAKAVKASDLANIGSGLGASIIGLEDAGGYTSADNVEDAIAELYSLSGNKIYTVGAGGVTKGDLVYVSANDTVTVMPINAMHRAVGLALETVAAAGQVAVQGFDYVIPGAVAGATAGTRYYWNGSALSTTIPAGGGSYVWQAGVAVNATDLLCAMEFIKKNS